MNGNGTPRATMMDVARKAGVSLKSVSRVINGEDHVSQKLRDKVKTAIEAMGYVPDVAARSLAGNRNFTIGLLFDNPSANYRMKIQAGAYEACRNAGYHLRIDSLSAQAEGADLEQQIAAVVRQNRCDGLVLTPPLTDNLQILDILERSQIPYVRIAPVLAPGRSKAVEMDDYQAGCDVARMLHALGHRHFAVINGPLYHGRAGYRRNGFVETFRSLCPDAEIMEEPGDFTFYSGMIAGKKILSRSNGPIAIFATNDDMAAGALNAAQQMGLRVPEDVSVCGFDDGIIAMTVWPYLTTIHQPIAEMAEVAVQMLIDWADKEPSLRHIDYHMVERDSVAAPGENSNSISSQP
ncbi:MAG: LacI family DNA-binding transcriptional regulator [Sphingobium sp.]|nr:LacI family DNA-binding transcriptional regulator [Sphingobium sp.]